jgi:hypothetical protein
MGNVITTPPQRGGDARARAAELTAQYAMQRAAVVAAMQSSAQPVAPKPSYDELVVAEANRRIEAEKQREIALAEKKRFEEDVAEKIAIAKDPNHKTRAMIEEYNKPENVRARRAASIQKMKLQIIEQWCPSHLKLTDDDRNKLEKLMAEYYKLIHKKDDLERGLVGDRPYDFAEIMYHDKVRRADILKERETIYSIYGQRPRRR